MATVSAAGVVTGIAPGSAMITAMVEGVTATATITVTPVPVAAVSVSPASASLVVGATQALTASARDAAGNALTGRTVTWSSGTPSVAAVSAAGVVTAVAPGSATITATVEGVTATAALTVTPVPVAAVSVSPASASLVVGTTQALTASARDASGNVLTGRAVTWSSGAPAVASVSASGVVTAVTPGSATITATVEGVTATAVLTVTPVPVSAVSVSLTPSSIQQFATGVATATLRDASGNALTGRIVTWASGNPTVAVIDASGTMTAVAPGTTVITATSEGLSGAATLTVTQAPVASVTLTPASGTLQVGTSGSFQVTLRDAQANVLTGRTVLWGTTNPAVAQVSASGIVTGIAPGTATITATSEGRSGSALVTVTSIPVASVSLVASRTNIPTGGLAVILATVRDAAGNVLTGRTVTWTTSNFTVVDGYAYGDTAVITGLQSGAATVTATSEGRQASVVITVTPPVTNICSLIAGASIFGSDGQYLGRFTNRFDSQSVLNQFGLYGSPYQTNSTNNTYGTYGSPYSSRSARNPYASSPPSIIRNGTFIAYYTTNEFRTPGVAPAYALTCDFP